MNLRSLEGPKRARWSGEAPGELSSACHQCGEKKSRGVKMPLADGGEDGRGGCGVQTTADTSGARLPPGLRVQLLIACLIHWCSESPHFFFCPDDLRRH